MIPIIHRRINIVKAGEDGLLLGICTSTERFNSWVQTSGPVGL